MNWFNKLANEVKASKDNNYLVISNDLEVLDEACSYVVNTTEMGTNHVFFMRPEEVKALHCSIKCAFVHRNALPEAAVRSLLKVEKVCLV